MSDEQNTEVQLSDAQIIAASPFAGGFQFVRNGITASCKIFVGTRNAWKGRPYPAFQVECEPRKEGQSEADSITQDTTFLTGLVVVGKDNLVNLINVFLRRTGQDNLTDSIPEKGENAGVLQIEALRSAWENLAAASLKLSELREQYNIANNEYRAYTSKDFIAELTSGDEARKNAAIAKQQQLINAVNSYAEQIEIRSAKRSKEAEVETVSPE